MAETLPQLGASFQQHRMCALQAPPGSGKTLLAPITLWESSLFTRVTVLEPRRVTARLPALALRPLCGELVGYRIRFDSLWSQAKTKIGYLTYGTALRVFREEHPKADELVIFDEFHERSWEAELLLAQLRQAGTRILLMSATLDRDSLPPEVPLFESDGRLHPVEVRWEQQEPQILQDNRKLAGLVSQRSQQLAREHPGEQLIFLPGMSAMRAVRTALQADPLSGPVDLLHSSLQESEINRVVDRPPGAGFRRVLSTDLAESSVTLAGVSCVIDAGLRREPLRDSLGLGVTLRTSRAPKASLAQRAGRAGRLGPGLCHRLFTKEDELHREEFIKPQILEIDGKILALHLAASGQLANWETLPWLTAPHPESVVEALSWLNYHDLVRDNVLTARGRLVLNAPCGPRAGLLGALASESGCDATRTAQWCYAIESGPPRAEVAISLSELLRDRDWLKRRDRRLLERLERAFPSHEGSGSALPSLLTRAFADTVAQWRNDRAVMRSEKQPALWFKAAHSPAEASGVVLSTAPFGRPGGPLSKVALFEPISTETLWEELFEELTESEDYTWDASSLSVRGQRQVKLGDLTLERSALRVQPGPEVARILEQNLRPALFGEQYHDFERRLRLFLEHCPDQLPEALAYDDPEAALLALRGSFFLTVTAWTKVCPQEMVEHIRGLLGYEFCRLLDKQLPRQVQMPRRRRPVSICYPEDGRPYLASKLQDFFGWTPPKLLNGRVPLLFHLLAPNGRPAQITDDLDGFWRGSYAQVRKDLRGRYPKHDWPEEPTRRG